jgi:hypothetical protein
MNTMAIKSPVEIILWVIVLGDIRRYPAVCPVDEGKGQPDGDGKRRTDDEAGQEIVPQPAGERYSFRDIRHCNPSFHAALP